MGEEDRTGLLGEELIIENGVVELEERAKVCAELDIRRLLDCAVVDDNVGTVLLRACKLEGDEIGL